MHTETSFLHSKTPFCHLLRIKLADKFNTGFDTALDFNDTSLPALYKLGQSNRLTNGAFCSFMKTRNHNATSQSLNSIRQQGQSGSNLPKLLINLNVAFKCFEQIIILLLPLLWFIGGGKPTHISSKHSIFTHKEAVGCFSVALGRGDEILKSLPLFIDTRLCRSSR